MTFEFSEVHHVNVVRDSITAERAQARGTGLDIQYAWSVKGVISHLFL